MKPTHSLQRLFPVATGFVSLMLLPALHAATFDATVNSDYANGGNWSTLAVPTGTEAVSIGSGGATRSAIYNTATGFTTSGQFLLGSGSGSNGTLQLDSGAGTLQYNYGSFPTAMVGHNGGTGTLVLNSGTFQTGGQGDLLVAAYGTNSKGTVTVAGGTLNIGNRIIMPDGAGGDAAVTLGSGAINITSSVVYGGGEGTDTSTSKGAFNLNGGTLTLDSVWGYIMSANCNFNFNGGTLKNKGVQTDFLRNSGTSGSGNIKYNVLSGGAIFDTSNGNATAAATLIAATGNGGLTKTGTNTLTLSGIASGSAMNMTVNNGTLNLARTGMAYNNAGGTGNGGTLTVNPGATLQINGSYNIGYQQAVYINGGTMDIARIFTGDGQNYTLNLNLSNGGQIISSTGSSLRWGELGNATITVTGTTPSTISANLYMIGGGGYNGTINVVDPNGSLNYNGIIQKHSWEGILTAVPLIKTGDGTLYLNAANTYASSTTVSAGRLVVAGSTGTSPVTVEGGATLEGTGTIGGTVTIQNGGTLSGTPTVSGGVSSAGTITPGGSSIATLTVNNTLNLQSGSTTNLQIDKTSGVTTQDQLFVNSVTYGGTLQVTATGETLAAGDSFQLFDSLAHGGTFDTYNLPALGAGLSWDISGLSTTGTITVVDTLPTPTFSPLAGGYIGPVNITISCIEPGTTIYYTYTNDGSTPPNPTTSSSSGTAGSSSASINMPTDSIMTIKAMAVKAGSANSPIAVAEYGTVIAPVWTLDGIGNWSDPANWYRGAVGQGSEVTVDFSTVTQTGTNLIALDGSKTIGSLACGDFGNGFSSTISATGGSVLTLDNGASASVVSVANQRTTISAPLAGTQGLVKTGAGTLVLAGSNSYGPTTVQDGTLVVDSAGALPTGQPVAISNSTVQVNSTTQWNYYKFVTSTSLGAGSTLNLAGGATEIHQLTLSGGTLAGSNPDPLYGTWGFNTPLAVEPIIATGGVTSTISATKIDSAWANPLTFQVETGSTLDVTGTIGGNSGHGAFGVTKTGPGLLVLAASNTYTGTTAVNSGTLKLGVTNALTNASNVSLGAATLTLADSASNTAGTLDVTAAATLNLGSLSTLAFADSSAVDWTDGTLHITGSFVPGTSLRFGTTASGLTPDQLALITIPGHPSLALDANGYVIDGGGFSSWQAANGGSTGGAEADHDGDGVSNGVEYFIGGPNNTTGYTALPGLTGTSITWTKHAGYTGTYGTDFVIETSETLSGTWNQEALGGNVIQSGDSFTYTFPPGGPNKKFVRLAVKITP